MLASIKRLETGLDTLMRTNKDVKSLQEFLEVKRVEVEAKKQLQMIYWKRWLNNEMRQWNKRMSPIMKTESR